MFLFQQTLKELIKSRGITQKELAEFLGVKQNTVSDWINRGTSPKIEHIYRIADYFSVSFDFLFTNDSLPIIVDAKEIIKDRLETDERNIIDTYRELDDYGKDLVQRSIREIWADHRQPKCKSTTTENKNIG